MHTHSTGSAGKGWLQADLYLGAGVRAAGPVNTHVIRKVEFGVEAVCGEASHAFSQLVLQTQPFDVLER